MKGVKKMAGIGGDGSGDGNFGADPTAGELGMLGLGEGDVSPGQGGAGVGGGVGDTGSLSDFAGGGQPGLTPQGPGNIPPVVAQVSTQTPEVVKESPKVTEAKAAVTRKARRRTLLGGEEGGLEPTNIFRRSILGS